MVLKRFLLVALLTVCPVVANTILVTGVDSSLGLQQSIYLNENGAPTQIYWAGAIDISVDGYTRLVYCVDLFTDIYLATTYNTTMDFADTPNLQRVGWLLQNQVPVNQVQGAALQLAIWDIMEDNGNGFGAGSVAQSTDLANPTNPAVLLLAQQYETVSAGQSSTSGIVYHNVTLNGTTVQTLMGTSTTVHNDGGPSPNPEPATLILILGGLVMIAVSRLRRGTNPR
jgi:hypothetical protein